MSRNRRRLLSESLEDCRTENNATRPATELAGTPGFNENWGSVEPLPAEHPGEAGKRAGFQSVACIEQQALNNPAP